MKRKIKNIIDPLYFDYNATTPIDPVVLETMLPYFKKDFGNPSSSHIYGQRAKKAIERARLQVSNLLGCTPEEIMFCSGATESINYTMKGLVQIQIQKNRQNHEKKPIHIIISSIEHPAVRETTRYLSEKEDCTITSLPVDKDGLVSTSTLLKEITNHTRIISIMHSNNEIGTIQNISELCKEAKKISPDIIFHCDASQSVGKIPVNVKNLRIDLLTIAGHKFYAPKGIGALYINKSCPFLMSPLIHGGNQEFSRRAGTENVALIAALGMACEITSKSLFETSKHLRLCRDRLLNQIETKLNYKSMYRVNSNFNYCLPNTLSISFLEVCAQDIINDSDIAASTGAACHESKNTISYVLSAIQVPKEYVKGTIRLSVGKYTTMEEVDACADKIVKAFIKCYPH